MFEFRNCSSFGINSKSDKFQFFSILCSVKRFFNLLEIIPRCLVGVNNASSSFTVIPNVSNYSDILSGCLWGIP